MTELFPILFWYYVINCSIFNWNADLSEISSSNHNPTVGSYRIDYCLLKMTGISYKEYYAGGSYLNMLIVPSTVALGIPLYRSFHLMKHHIRSILLGIFVACIVNTVFTALIAKWFGMDFF